MIENEIYSRDMDNLRIVSTFALYSKQIRYREWNCRFNLLNAPVVILKNLPSVASKLD
jgi:hypothetical protein